MPESDTSTSPDFEKIYERIREALHFYNSISCQCAFPRFRQYAEVDCVATGDSYALRETEAIIEFSKIYFDISTSGPYALYTCKKCGSTYDFEWQDFSIYVSRSSLKLTSLHTEEIGAAPRLPIPAAAGPYGHSYPGDLFKRVDSGTLYAYLTEIESGLNT